MAQCSEWTFSVCCLLWLIHLCHLLADLYSTESRKSNLTDSTNSRSQLTANQMSHLALSIDQASKGLHIDDSSTPEDTLMSHSKTAPDSVRASSSNKSLSDLRTTAVSLPPQPPAKAVTSSTSPIQPVCCHLLNIPHSSRFEYSYCCSLIKWHPNN